MRMHHKILYNNSSEEIVSKERFSYISEKQYNMIRATIINNNSKSTKTNHEEPNKLKKIQLLKWKFKMIETKAIKEM
jgi:hypothetical protein